MYFALIDRSLVAKTYRPLCRGGKSYRATRFSPETFLIAIRPQLVRSSRNVADYDDKIDSNEPPFGEPFSEKPIALILFQLNFVEISNRSERKRKKNKIGIHFSGICSSKVSLHSFDTKCLLRKELNCVGNGRLQKYLQTKFNEIQRYNLI